MIELKFRVVEQDTIIKARPAMYKENFISFYLFVLLLVSKSIPRKNLLLFLLFFFNLLPIME
jgi:hypothetical protein